MDARKKEVISDVVGNVIRSLLHLNSQQHIENFGCGKQKSLLLFLFNVEKWWNIDDKNILNISQEAFAKWKNFMIQIVRPE